MKTYGPLIPVFRDREKWSLPLVLSERARTHAGKPFLRVPRSGFEATFDEMEQQARRLATGLLSSGGAPGDRVLIMAENSAAFIQAWFGCAYAGMVEVPINTGYVGAFLEHQVATVKPRVAIIDAEFAPRFLECESVERFYLLGDRGGREEAARALRAVGSKTEPFDALLAHQPGELPTPTPRRLTTIFFTSGTTGPSKGVMMSHSHMHFFAEEGANLTKLTDSDIYMAVGPLFHGNSQFLAAYPALISGAEFILHERFSATQWLGWVREGRVTVTNFLGVMMDFVWKQPDTDVDRDNALRCIFAAPTAFSILDDFKKRFGVETFVEGFGLTETGAPILTPYGEDRPIGAVGRLVDEWFDVRIVDPESDEEVSPGEVGELIVRPKYPWTTCMGYFGMPEKTVEAFRNLWFHTGDGLRRDVDGWYYFVDRLKDAIRRRGENISSYEVEQAILQHPDVVECAVVAVPAAVEAGEEEVMAVIVPRPRSALTPERIWTWCDRRVPKFAVPRYVRFATSLPKTPSGKDQKAKLREAGVDGSTADRTSTT